MGCAGGAGGEGAAGSIAGDVADPEFVGDIADPVLPAAGEAEEGLEDWEGGKESCDGDVEGIGEA
jgi:hypothetical protein